MRAERDALKAEVEQLVVRVADVRKQHEQVCVERNLAQDAYNKCFQQLARYKAALAKDQAVMVAESILHRVFMRALGGITKEDAEYIAYGVLTDHRRVAEGGEGA